MLKHFASITVSLSFLGILQACDRPWAVVPQTTTAPGSCVGDLSVLTACEWARGFDDLLIFNIDSVESRTEPLFSQGVAVNDAETCRLVDPALAYQGSIEASARGSTASEIIVPGDHEPIDQTMLLPKTRVLVAVHRASNEALVRSEWPVLNEGVIARAGNPECYSGSALVGLSPSELIAAVEQCPSVGDLVDRELINGGAVCFPEESATECTLDSDCIGPNRVCDSGVCRDS